MLAENDVYCASIDWKGHVDYTLSSPDRKNAIVKKEQYFALMDSRNGYRAKSFVIAKIENQKAVLGTLVKSRDDNEYLINQRDKLSESLEKLSKIYNKTADSLRNKIMGIEGQASAEYWQALQKFWMKNGILSVEAADLLKTLSIPCLIRDML